jgi:hypothetical protein
MHGDGGGRTAGADLSAPVPELHSLQAPHAADLLAEGANST